MHMLFAGHTAPKDFYHGDQVRASVSEGQPPVGAFAWHRVASISHTSFGVLIDACLRVRGSGRAKIRYAAGIATLRRTPVNQHRALSAPVVV